MEAVTDRKFCCDCRYCVPSSAFSGDETLVHADCTAQSCPGEALRGLAPQFADAIKGAKRCQAMRILACREGQLFEPKSEGATQ